jgi:hypothetical protein
MTAEMNLIEQGDVARTHSIRPHHEASQRHRRVVNRTRVLAHLVMLLAEELKDKDQNANGNN